MPSLLRAFALSFVLVALAACGGGGGKSSSGGGSAVYRGSETVRFTSPDASAQALIVETYPLSIEVRGRSVRVTNVDDDVFTGNLSGSSFVAQGVIPLGDVGAGVVCGDANVTYKGDIDGGTITGTMASQTRCTAFGRAMRIHLNGSFSVNRNARQTAGGGSMSGAIRQAVQRLH